MINYELFITSSPFMPGECDITELNNMAENLRNAVPADAKALFIPANPYDQSFAAGQMHGMRTAMERLGITFSRFAYLDMSNTMSAERLIRTSNLIVLGGGHLPTQNTFLKRIKMREILNDMEGKMVFMGISAGAMNLADEVYSSPEEPGEALDPNYERFITGLGLTTRNIMPHYNTLQGAMLDGMRLFEDIIYEDSRGKEILIFPDGTYIHTHDGKEELYGQAWLCKDAVMTPICNQGEVVEL